MGQLFTGFLHGKFPVDQLVEHGINIVGPPVLVIQVVSVLPHINGEQWLDAHCLGDACIGSLDHLEQVAVENKPGPAAPESSERGGFELIFEFRKIAEGSFDSELSGYFTLSEPALNISGSAYEDKNSNGKIDSGEALAGWTIQLVKPDNSQVSVLTKDDGSYRFEQLKAGSYTVSESLLPGWTKTAPKEGSYTVDLKDSDIKGLDFANNKPTLYTISGMKFNDLNGNGVFDGEPGMEGWTIQLSKDGSPVNTTTTGKDGSYRFAGLAPGSYSVAEVEQSGWTRTAPKEGSYSLDLKDSDVAGKDFGNHGSFSISGTSFVDTNGNGVKDSDETGQADRSLQLSLNGNGSTVLFIQTSTIRIQ